ncbi:MAG: hypothetical protein PHV74_15255 [Dehalococcoidia bacterium]|nr:hypothetical protein [Dehalococcoidia bacterium]
MKLTIEELDFVTACLKKLAAAWDISGAAVDVLTPEDRRMLLQILKKHQAEEILPGSTYGEG